MPPFRVRHKDPVCLAVRSLRLRLHHTQQTFAVFLGLAIRTIARYETIRPPSGKALVRFANLARENDLEQISETLHHALVLELASLLPASNKEDGFWNTLKTHIRQKLDRDASLPS
jgi:transcriptional regulator with XRE-family HTH domain